MLYLVLFHITIGGQINLIFLKVHLTPENVIDTMKRTFGASVFTGGLMEHTLVYPNHSVKRCGRPEAFTSTRDTIDTKKIL